MLFLKLRPTAGLHSNKAKLPSNAHTPPSLQRCRNPAMGIKEQNFVDWFCVRSPLSLFQISCWPLSLWFLFPPFSFPLPLSSLSLLLPFHVYSPSPASSPSDSLHQRSSNFPFAFPVSPQSLPIQHHPPEGRTAGEHRTQLVRLLPGGQAIKASPSGRMRAGGSPAPSGPPRCWDHANLRPLKAQASCEPTVPQGIATHPQFSLLVPPVALSELRPLPVGRGLRQAARGVWTLLLI